MEYARQTARRYADLARVDAEALPPSEARDVLVSLSELVVSRQD